jgi:15-cis-phytoene synthase/lycopene beta-cyclase
VISQGAWSYPIGSILGKINHIPIEEHMFFILQPVFLVLLHSICTLPQLFPFSVRKLSAPAGPRDLVQTLQRRPAAAAAWVGVFGWGASLLWEVQQSQTEGYTGVTGPRGFYLGMILCWISPVIGWLTYLGGDAFGTRGDVVAWTLGTGYLWMVDT